MSPTADDGALIITFPRAWTADQRLEFMATSLVPCRASAGRTWAS